jgi:hypothetical protein
MVFTDFSWRDLTTRADHKPLGADIRPGIALSPSCRDKDRKSAGCRHSHRLGKLRIFGSASNEQAAHSINGAQAQERALLSQAEFISVSVR